MSLVERYQEIAHAIDEAVRTRDPLWANAAKALVKQLIRVEVPYGKGFDPEK